MAKSFDTEQMAAATDAISEQLGETVFSEPRIEEFTKPRFRGRSHLDMVRWLVERHGQDLRFVSDRENGHKTSESWAVWDKAMGIWLIGPGAASQVAEWINEMADDLRADFQEWIKELLGDVFDQSFKETANLNNEAEKYKKQLSKDFPELWAYWGFCKQMRDYNFTAALMNKLKLAKEIQVSLHAFDRNIYLVTVLNGLTIDLRGPDRARYGHGESVFRARREDYITRRIEIRYDKAALCPKFYEYLEYAQPKEEMRVFLRRIAGLCLTGNVNDQAIFLIYGEPLTGKSIFSAVLKALLGPYAATLDVDSLVETKWGRSGPDDGIARLHHARAAFVDEPAENTALDASRLKRLVGGSGATISVNPKHKAGFEATPEYKFVMTANFKPKLNDTSGAIFRRFYVIGFDRKVLSPNTNLIYELMEELPGILNWAIAGAAIWAAEGLCPPEQVKVATNTYAQESNEVTVFLTTYFEFEEGADVTFGEIWKLYERFCREQKTTPMSTTKLGKELDLTRTINQTIVGNDGNERTEAKTYQGFEKERVGGHSWRKGLRIKDEYKSTPGQMYDRE
jgi:P4 family phage/plasmid primase-like protien